MAEIKYSIARPSFLGNEKKYLTDTIESGWISSIGSYIEKFENQFAAMHGTRHAIATHNGTIALHLALAACGITEGDEVIVPDLTFIATANSVSNIAHTAGLETPITTMVAALCEGRIALPQAINTLMTRPLKEE